VVVTAAEQPAMARDVASATMIGMGRERSAVG
jgi:hypothetical protein